MTTPTTPVTQVEAITQTAAPTAHTTADAASATDWTGMRAVGTMANIQSQKVAAQAQTAHSLYGASVAVQTDASSLGMVAVETSTDDLVSTKDASTSHYLVPGVGLVHLASQTEEAVVAVSDYEELDAAMAASVEEAQHAAEAKCQATAADGLVTAIINRKRIQMDSVRYNVMWCERVRHTWPGPACGGCPPWCPLVLLLLE